MELTKAMQKIIQEMGTEINNTAVTTSQAPPPATVAQDDQDNDKQKSGGARQINQQTVAALKWGEDVLTLKWRFDNIWKTSFNSDQTISTWWTQVIFLRVQSSGRLAQSLWLTLD